MASLILIWLLNFVISAVNAWGCGQSWNTTKSLGGWTHFINWMGATMSACGFTWCYSFVFIGSAYKLGFLDASYATLAIELAYVALILPILGSGLAIIINSWIHFYHSKGLVDGVVAGYNTYAQYRNTSSAIQFLPGILSDIKQTVSGRDNRAERDDDSKKVLLLLIAVGLVIVALCLGILTTRYIILLTSNA